MATDQESGQIPLRSQFFDKTLKGFANRMYKFKQLVNVVPTSAWINFFYRESTGVLQGGTGNTTSGIPRGASFPHAVQQYDKIKSVITKFGLEQNIAWEDILTDDIDVQSRALYKIAEGVTKSVDDTIWDVLTESRIPVGISTISMSIAYNGVNAEWNSTSAAIVDNLLQAKQILFANNYDASNAVLVVNPRDYRSIIKWVTDKGAQFTQTSNDMLLNGEVQGIAGLRIIVSNSVTTSCALVCIPKICGTWRELVPLQTTTKQDDYISVTVRAVEEGVCQLTDPKSCVLIQGTEHSPGTAHP